MNNSFSIILPVLNGGNYVKDCINSILSQTYTNFNLIVLDNCSTDGTKEWIESLNNSRIIVYSSKTHLSITESWSRAKDIKKNEFMTMIGHDDLLYPDFLAKINTLITENPAASIYQTHFKFIDGSDQEIKKCKPMVFKQESSNLLENILKSNIDIFGTGFVYKSAVYDKFGGLPDYPNLLFADYEIWLRITNEAYLITSPKECFAYRIHAVSTTSKSSEQITINAFDRFIRFIFSFEVDSIQKVLNTNIRAFYLKNAEGICSRLLRKPLKLRNNLTINNAFRQLNNLNKSVLGDYHINLYQSKLLCVLLILDSNFLTRGLFRVFKKIYNKPIYK